MFVTFGEIMMRITPPGALCFRQALPGTAEITFGGGEANVAVSLSLLGNAVRYVTALPRNPLAETAAGVLRATGVDTSHVLWRKEGRLGIYFLETGANQRASNVIYDRAGSAISLAEPAEYPFDGALAGARWLHVTGITPAISEPAFKATLEAVRKAKAAGAAVACDLNFRKKLWNWRPGTSSNALARECMSAILRHADLVIGNEEDAESVLGIAAAGAAIEKGVLHAAAYEAVARGILQQFPNVGRVAITLRESVSATHNNWGGMLMDRATDRAYFAPLDERGAYAPYPIRDIVDRVGSGDSFAAGLLHALGGKMGAAPAEAIRFAVAASCLKHSIKGDFNYATEAEILTLTKGDASGRVKR
jgi:2-dehydro-3-deoxygluconokinase